MVQEIIVGLTQRQKFLIHTWDPGILLGLSLASEANVVSTFMLPSVRLFLLTDTHWPFTYSFPRADIHELLAT